MFATFAGGGGFSMTVHWQGLPQLGLALGSPRMPRHVGGGARGARLSSPARKVESPVLQNPKDGFSSVRHDSRVEVDSGLVQSKALLVLPDLVRRGARRNQGGNVLPALVRCSRFGSTLAGIAPSARNGRRSGSLRSPACGWLPATSSALGAGARGGGAPRGPAGLRPRFSGGIRRDSPRVGGWLLTSPSDLGGQGGPSWFASASRRFLLR